MLRFDVFNESSRINHSELKLIPIVNPSAIKLIETLPCWQIKCGHEKIHLYRFSHVISHYREGVSMCGAFKHHRLLFEKRLRCSLKYKSTKKTNTQKVVDCLQIPIEIN